MGNTHGTLSEKRQDFDELKKSAVQSRGNTSRRRSRRSSKVSFSLYVTTPENANFFRLTRLILDVGNNVMRDLLRTKIAGGENALTERIASSKQELEHLGKYQKKILFPPKREVKYEMLDFTLMYAVCRNVLHEEIEPNSKENKRWGKTPNVGDTSLLGAIERIRECRNIFFAHATSSDLKDETFNDLWTKVETAIDTINKNLDATIASMCYRTEMTKLRTSPTDPGCHENAQKLFDMEKKLNDHLKMEAETNRRLEKLLQFRRDYELDGSIRLQHKENSLHEEDSMSDKRRNKPQSENPYEKDIFEEWRQEDMYFFPTKASTEVEKRIQSKNLVFVIGHSGSGKSIIIQHIALKCRVEGWTVKPVDTVDDIKKAYESGNFTESKTVFVFNDPFGKDSFDHIEYQKWVKLENTLLRFLKKVKLFVTCRKCVFDHPHLKGIFKESYVVSIDDCDLKLSKQEKEQIFKKYAKEGMDSEGHSEEIMEIDTYFPLLCKLHACKQYHADDTISLFTEPVRFFEKEIQSYRKHDKEKYCALACLVFFSNKLCLNDLKENKTCFSDCVKISGITECISPANVVERFESLIGSFVKNIGHTYQFYHDLIMEVTTFVFGTNYCEEIIKHADIGFLRKRLRFQNVNERRDSLTILIGEKYISNLSNRFYEEIFSNRVLEVVLNPCLRNMAVTRSLIEKLLMNQKKMPNLLQNTQTLTGIQLSIDTNKEYWHSRFHFLNLLSEISPLFALIVFEHDDLSLTCLKTLQKMRIDLRKSNLFFAVCSNGSSELFHMFSKDEVNRCLNEQWGELYPFQIAILLGNVKSLKQLIALGMDVNMRTGTCTPLTFAVEMECKKDSQNSSTLNEIVKLLLDNGANVNLCLENGNTPLYMACQNGQYSTANILLENGAAIYSQQRQGQSSFCSYCKWV